MERTANDIGTLVRGVDAGVVGPERGVTHHQHGDSGRYRHNGKGIYVKEARIIIPTNEEVNRYGDRTSNYY